MRRYAIAALLSVASWGSVVHAATTGVSFGSAALFSNRDCNVPSSTNCTVGTPIFTQYFGGANQMVGQGPSTIGYVGAEDMNGSGATAYARALLPQAANYLPRLGVASYSGDLTRTSANVSAFQVVTYRGASSIDLALKGVINFANSGGTSNTAFGSGVLSAYAQIYPISKLDGLSPSSTGEQIYNQPFFNFGDCNTGAIAFGQYFSPSSGGDHLGTISLSTKCDGSAITINPGDSFVVKAIMQGVTNRGGYADAMHTLDMQYDLERTVFSGTSTPVGSDFLSANFSAASALPEPATWAMMIGGFGMIGSSIRYRRRRTKVTFATA